MPAATFSDRLLDCSFAENGWTKEESWPSFNHFQHTNMGWILIRKDKTDYEFSPRVFF
jgi:hypothetical protein